MFPLLQMSFSSFQSLFVGYGMGNVFLSNISQGKAVWSLEFTDFLANQNEWWVREKIRWSSTGLTQTSRKRAQKESQGIGKDLTDAIEVETRKWRNSPRLVILLKHRFISLPNRFEIVAVRTMMVNVWVCVNTLSSHQQCHSVHSYKDPANIVFPRSGNRQKRETKKFESIRKSGIHSGDHNSIASIVSFGSWSFLLSPSLFHW